MTAIITGGTRGIGLGIVEKLLAKGYTVIASAREKNEKASELEVKYNGYYFFYPCDISKGESRNALVQFVLTKFGKIDLLVNNAGVAPKARVDILEVTVEDYDYVMDINLKGTFFMAQAVALIMAKQRSGRIINISSISSYTSSTNRAQYCISKAGISMITKLLADKMSGYGVGVFEIMPGIIDTDMTSTVHGKYAIMIENGLTPINRFGRAEDVAKCVVTIADGQLDFCQGQCLNVDGGYHIRRL